MTTEGEKKVKRWNKSWKNYNSVVLRTKKCGRGGEMETIVDMLAVTVVMSGLTVLEPKTSKAIKI